MLFVDDSLAVVGLFHLAQVLEIALHLDHMVMGDLIKVLTSRFVFLTQFVVLGKVLLLLPIDRTDGLNLMILFFLQSQLCCFGIATIGRLGK